MDLQSIKNRFGIIGNSPGLNHALSIAVQVAPTDLTTLIMGESGVGKEVFSHIIHQLSSRKHNPFIAVNCGAIPEGTIDSELFGHEKGSFTGAHEARKGYFETVNGGTIFLDEIGELPHGTQARLLRVLESQEFIRVGSSKVQKTDVRVIAATNVNLLEKVQIGKFREDLYYRLSTVPIKVPPLRERQEDIPLLFRRFCIDFAEKYKSNPVQLADDARDLLIGYSFPGNVRELKNIAEQVSVLAKNKVVSADELREFIPQLPQTTLPALAGAAHPSGEFSEREILYKVLFDMRNDINDLKRIVFGFMPADQIHPASLPQTPAEPLNGITKQDGQKPIVIESSAAQPIEVEESLSLAEKEKEMIKKALVKHRGRRKNAARDLGISERTLYRKIKEYGIPE
ncbi:MAG: sigma-54 dependent transcriptional regulator [Chitinophagales bacterium]|nr:sigma-54-dependent Fis family transcriptional regulator [Bacteroidota bacterium]MBX7141305.1 sigma-54 dependent transcriptional regulator [Chitinophagales bacterium]